MKNQSTCGCIVGLYVIVAIIFVIAGQAMVPGVVRANAEAQGAFTTSLAHSPEADLAAQQKIDAAVAYGMPFARVVAAFISLIAAVFGTIALIVLVVVAAMIPEWYLKVVLKKPTTKTNPPTK